MAICEPLTPRCRARNTGQVPGGETADRLLPELQASPLKHDAAGLVSLVVLPDVEREPPKERLVARNGQLVTVQEALPPGPNGTGFAITLAPAPELDGINLVVVRLLCHVMLCFVVLYCVCVLCAYLCAARPRLCFVFTLAVVLPRFAFCVLCRGRCSKGRRLSARSASCRSPSPTRTAPTSRRACRNPNISLQARCVSRSLFLECRLSLTRACWRAALVYDKQVAKSIGDARAKLAEKGFGRPLVSVRISKSGAV